MTCEPITRPRLYFDQDMAAPKTVLLPLGTAVVFSARCPGKSTANEDAAAILPFGDDAAVLVVADGLGGGAAGEAASRAALEAMRRAVDELHESGALLRTAILNGFERANEAVQKLGVGAATTLAAVELDGQTMRPYHVGDSMIMLIGGRGKIKLQTVSHSPVGYGVEAGLLDEGEAMIHEDRHLVSNVIGTPEMRIEIGHPRKLLAQDTVLLASDGLFDNLHSDEIAQIARHGKPAEICERLVSQSQLRMGRLEESTPSKPDDLTLIAFRRAKLD